MAVVRALKVGEGGTDASRARADAVMSSVPRRDASRLMRMLCRAKEEGQARGKDSSKQAPPKTFSRAASDTCKSAFRLASASHQHHFLG